MRCQCLVEFGAPLVMQEKANPAVSGTEVLLRITASGVCHSDLHIRDGSYDMGHGQRLEFESRGLHLPLVMGHEPAGVVIAMGPEAGAIDTSRNYVVYPWQGCGTCRQCKIGFEHFCASPRFLGMYADGGYADLIKIPHPRYLFDISDLEPAQAAPLACSGLTTFSALKKLESTLAHSPVVIIGAGGLGLMATGLVQAMGGMPPIVVDISAEKREAALKAGAQHAVDGSAPDAVEQIRHAIGDLPLGVLDLVGSESSSGLGFSLLPKGGKMVIVGLFGGAAPWSLPMIPVKAVTIMGSYVGSLAEFRELMTLAVSGKVPAVPITKRKLEEAEQVLEELSAGKIIGRAILE